MNRTAYTKEVIQGQYFPHLDGLRALAVLPVMLFHVCASLCPGGFAGVDVFFVISGYLITGGILRDLEAQRFTIRSFYHRRIRRIFPAYFVTILSVFILGCMLYYATPLAFLGDSVVAGSAFLSNVYFYGLGGDYFAPKLHSHALLHLWSLSVEEQFYLFIPLLCVVIWKLNRRHILLLLTLLAGASLAASIYAIHVGKTKEAFFFTHFRAWELLAGSLLAGISLFAPAALSWKNPGGLRPGFLAAIGLLLLLLPYGLLSSTTPFPALAALPSVLGTAILICYGQNGTIGRVLEWQPLVIIGKMSYSLYLWHWPIFVLWRYVTYDSITVWDGVGMLALSFLLGHLSWRYIEMPVRTMPRLLPRHSFAIAGAGILLLLVLGTACVGWQGWPHHLHRRANEMAYLPPIQKPFLLDKTMSVLRRVSSVIRHDFPIVMDYDRDMRTREAIYFSLAQNGSFPVGDLSAPPRVALIGDSHAGSLRFGLDAYLKQRQMRGESLVFSSTDVFNLDRPESQTVLQRLHELPRGSCVILAQMWQIWLAPDKPPMKRQEALRWIERYCMQLRAMGLRLLLVADVPNYNYGVYDVRARGEIIRPRDPSVVQESREQPESVYDRRNAAINEQLQSICARTGATFVPLHNVFKRETRYVTVDNRESGEDILYRDPDHLSASGSLLAARFLHPYISTESSTSITQDAVPLDPPKL